MISLFCYILFLYQLWHLCQYGGLKRHLPAMFAIIIVFLITFILWLIWGRRKRGQNKRKTVFVMEIILFIVGTLVFGGGIVYSAIPYHGELSWKLEEWRSRKNVTLEHNNFFTDGAEGVLDDLNEALDLPGELYIANKFQLTFAEDGTIQTIYTFLYGRDEKGETKTYLVDYDADKSEKMSVWINGEANADYDADMRLEPMLQILEKADCQQQVEEWAADVESGIYEILYFGKRSFQTEEGLVYFFSDERVADIYTVAKEAEGYEVSLYVPASEEIVPVRYMIDPEFTSQQKLDQERQEQQAEEAKKAESWTVDQTDGTMYFWLDEYTGWRLVVTDAALGSRFYVMEGTTDGGAVWSSVNDDPFAGSIGVAEGLMFFDKDFGFAGLASGSQSYSSIFVTRDGGATFEEVQLPMDTVSQLPELAAECGFTIDDYDYFSMPENENGVLTIKALTETGESEGIIFRSQDGGETWEYAGVDSE
jgi:hypothetical protein